MRNRPLFRLPWRSAERVRADLDAELRFHIEEHVRELVASGIGEAEARREAAREFGDLDGTRRYCLTLDEGAAREERRAQYLAELRQDAAHAWRGVRRAPGFAVVALVTLAIGVGATTAIFSVINRVLIEALPYRDAGRVMRLYGAKAEAGLSRGQISPADFMDFRAQQRTFDGLAAFSFAAYTYRAERGDPESIAAARVSANLFEVLGARPVLGRTFLPGEDAPGAAPVVVISHALWQRLFGGDPAIVGRGIALNDARRTVVGVMPAGFVSPTSSEAELWTPLDLSPVLADPNRARKWHFLGAVGRLRPGVTYDQARADLAGIAARLERLYPDANGGVTVEAVPMREALVGNTRQALLVLMGAAALVLLIACANVAGVLLSRTVARRQELAVRAALGASAARIARQLLTESVLLALAGGALGALVAWWGTGAIVRAAQGMLPALGAPVRVDAPVLLFALALSLATGLLFGVAPAVSAARPELTGALNDAGRGSTGGAARARLRAALVVGQMALAVVLLVGAGLLIRSLYELRQVPLGFDATRLLTFRINPGAKYASAEQESQLFDALGERILAIPGVVAVGSAGMMPLQGVSTASLAIDGKPLPDGRLPEIGYGVATAEYFTAMRIPLLRGRLFDARDVKGAPEVIIVSESAARQNWPGPDPLGAAVGARVRLGPNPDVPWSTVIGVVGDVRAEGAAAAPRPTAYESNRQHYWGSRSVVVRVAASTAPGSLIAAIRRELRAVDPTLPLVAPRTMDEMLDRNLAGRRLPMLLTTLFAAVALALAAVGVYAVMALTVAARTREFGIRMALGAQPADVLRLVLRRGLGAALLGLVLGLAGAAAMTRLLANLLFGVRPLDPPTLAAAGLLLVAAALLASLVPARRATRVDVVGALRTE
jgi:putative ABC transport system permease protein